MKTFLDCYLSTHYDLNVFICEVGTDSDSGEVWISVEMGRYCPGTQAGLLEELLELGVIIKEENLSLIGNKIRSGGEEIHQYKVVLG
jgi:hypothetical protein